MLALWISIFITSAPANTLPQQVLASAITIQKIEAVATAKDLAHSPGWLKLAHYHRTWFGTYQGEADGPNFYLANDGKFSPEHELKATLEAFAQPESTALHAQCQYLARRDFLRQQLGWNPQEWRWLPCSQQEQWLDKLDADQVSVVFATSYMNNPASMFGHTFFKFHTRGNTQDKDLLNYGVNFAADTGRDGGAQFIWRGLMGGYPGRFSMMPYHQQLKDYTNLDGRDIWEYRLTLSPREVRFLVKHLLELEHTYFDYYFLDKNCSYFILDALEAVRPEAVLTHDHAQFVIPADTIRTLARTPGWIAERVYRPSLATDFYRHADALESHEAAWVTRLTRGPELPQQILNDSSWLQLTAPHRAAILETAMLFASLREVHERRDWPERGYQLKVARASLGAQPDSADEKRRSEPPETGHDSSQLAVHLGAFDGQGFAELQARAAYHDLLSSETGYLSQSQMEVGRLRLRLEQPTQRLYLQELTVLNLLSAAPSDRYFQQISWSISIRGERLMDKGDLSQFDPMIDGGIGSTVRLPGLGHTYLLTLGQLLTQYGNDLTPNYRLGLGPKFILLTHLTSHWRIAANYEYRWYVSGEKSDFAIWGVENSVDTARNWEMRLAYLSVNQYPQASGSVLWHF